MRHDARPGSADLRSGTSIWLGGVLHGDFGYSLVSGRPIVDEIVPRLGPSLMLAGVAATIADRRRHPVRRRCRRSTSTASSTTCSAAFTILLISTPTFVLGLVGLYVFGVTLHVLPVGELYTFGKENDVIDRIAHLVLPAAILGLANAAPLVRYTRASMLEVMGSEYITTARSKGIVGRVVLIRHGLRNALIPIITLIAHPAAAARRRRGRSPRRCSTGRVSASCP